MIRVNMIDNPTIQNLVIRKKNLEESLEWSQETSKKDCERNPKER